MLPLALQLPASRQRRLLHRALAPLSDPIPQSAATREHLPSNCNMAAAPESSSASHSIYAQVDSYAWDTDAEFQSGLGAILGSTASPEQAVELALRARCFYYSRYATRSILTTAPHATPPLELRLPWACG